MNKRAMTVPVYLVGEFVLVGILIFMFGNAMAQSSNPLLVEQAVTAEDVARTLDIAQSTALDFRYEYPESLEGYTVNLQGDSVSLVVDGETPPETDFSFNKRYYTLRKGAQLPKEQNVDVSYFYVTKKGDEIKLGDFSSKDEVEIFTVTDREKPNITIDYGKDGITSFDFTIEKLALVVNEELKRNFVTDDSRQLVVKISYHEESANKDNIIYYSSAGEIDTKPISENLQTILEDELSLLIVPLSKNYGQEKTIELSLSNSIENKNLLSEDDYKRKLGYFISFSLNKYYGVGRWDDF